jgi:glycosyltransferase involved in cell wall biosynthesis
VTPTPQISVVIPCFNEEQTIGRLCAALDDAVAKLAAAGRSAEVILVDDGSSDGTFPLLKTAAATRPWLRLVRFRRNFGQTAAMAAGFDRARGAYVVPMDADLQNDPDDIPLLLARLEEGFDIVSGWRKNRQDKALSRKLPSKIANWLIGRVTGVRLHDYGCTLKAYRRWALENVRLYGEMHRYIPIYASWEGARVTELPVVHHPRLHGRSKYGFSRIPRVVLDLLVIFFFDHAMDRPMHFFGKIGLYSLAAAFLAGLYAVWLRFGEGTAFIKTPLPLLVVLLTVTALLCIFFGVIAEIQMRTYYESRGKRAYIVRKTINID